MTAPKFFPIKQGVACQLKWTWNTVRLAEAKSASCHRVQGVKLTRSNFHDLHNHPTWIQHREMQLAGKFPQQGCQYCEKIEQAGGISDRNLHQQVPDVYPLELDSNPLATHVTPRILEIFINNRCNLSCIYCDESNSTRIEKENKTFGYSIPGIDDSIKLIPQVEFDADYDQLFENFFLYLESIRPTLRQLHALGGEPFYQKEFFRLVDFLDRHQSPDLEFTVVSNLMVSKLVLQRFVDRMKQILTRRGLKRLNITASLDCLGPEQEYLRHGIDLDQWQENFEFLAEHKWLNLTVNNTITSLSIRTMPDLLIYINRLRPNRKIDHSFGLVDGRLHLNPIIFGAGFFHDDFDKVISLMDTSNDHARKSVEYMKGIQKSLDRSCEDIVSQQHLKHYLDEMDRRRNTHWASTFPWLADHFENKYHVV
jgi:hypothetical protein